MIRVRAGPEHAHLFFETVVGDAVVVGQSAFAGESQFAKDVLRALVRKLVTLAEPCSQIAKDLPILFRFAGRLDRLPHADDAALAGGHRPFVFLVQRARQNDVCVPRRFTHEEIAAGKEIQPLQRLRDVVRVGQRDEWIETNRDQSFDLTVVNPLHDLDGGMPF